MTSVYVTVSPVLSATTPAPARLWSTLTFRRRHRALCYPLQGQACTRGEACSLTAHLLIEDFGVQGNPQPQALSCLGTWVRSQLHAG